MKRYLVVFLLAAVILVPGWHDCPAQHFEQDLHPLVGIRGKGAYTIPAGEFSLDMHVETRAWKYTFDPTPGFPLSGDEYRYRYHRMEIQPTLYYGITNRSQVEITVPYVDIEETGDPVAAFAGDSNSGMGDTMLRLKYRYPAASGLFIDYAISVGVELSSSNENKTPLQGTGGTDLEFGFHFTSELQRGVIFGDLAYTFMSEWRGANSIRTDPGDVLSYHIAYNYPLFERLRLVAAVEGERTGMERVGGDKIPFTDSSWIFLCPGLQYVPAEGFVIEGTILWPVSGHPRMGKSSSASGVDKEPWYYLGMYWEF